MNTDFSIKNADVHLWRAHLPSLTGQIESFLTILSPDEKERADRFRFAEHRERFILARGLLRHILHRYTGILAQEIQFKYGKHGKPYLNNHPIHFNTSHSHEMAVYALTLNKEIGVDIEKIEPDFKDGVAKRFFSPAEYHYLVSLPESQRHLAFYSLWARKEAIIKTLGKGLFTPLESFSVLTTPSANNLTMAIDKEEYHFHLEDFTAHAEYQAAFATQEPITKIYYWEWREAIDNVSNEISGTVAWR